MVEKEEQHKNPVSDKVIDDIAKHYDNAPKEPFSFRGLVKAIGSWLLDKPEKNIQNSAAILPLEYQKDTVKRVLASDHETEKPANPSVEIETSHVDREATKKEQGQNGPQKGI